MRLDIPDQLSLSVMEKTFIVDWKDLPFWQAAAQIETFTGKRWGNSQPGNIVLVTPSLTHADLSSVVAAQTPYVLVLGSYLLRSSYQEVPMNGAEAPALRNHLSINLQAYTDPKIPTASSSLTDCKFQLEEGGPWTDLPITNSNYSPRGPMSELRILLPPEMKPGTVISRLTGTYNTALVPETKTWKVPDILATPTISETVSASKITLESAQFEGRELKLRLSFSVSLKEAGFGYVDEWLSALKLTDFAGNLLSAPTQSTDFGPSKEDLLPVTAELTYSSTEKGAPIAPGPIALNWTLPLASRSFSVPFELKDVKVP
jgi:hypothetical protein